MNGVEGGSGGGPNDDKFVYAEGTVDEKVGFIFDRMKESSFLGDCRNKLKSELKRQLSNMDDDDEDDFHVNLTYMMQRLGLVHAIKTFVMDIHTEGTKDKRDFGKQNAILVTMDPDRRETLDAIEVARKAWEAFTTDALREYVRQTAMPLVVHHQELAATKETSETSKPHVASQFLFSRQYAKTGSPITLRPHIWRQALSVAIDPIYFKQLEAKVKASTVVTDGLFMLDVQQTTDSSDYFPFEDHLRSVMLAFSRDEQVVASQAVMTLQHPVVFQSNASCSKMAIPPANVMPFHGLVMFVAPLCYLYDDPVHVYFVFRDMYCRYWCQLTGISARPNAILALCKTFETLIHRHIPAVVQHLLQVLLLWDRVVGYDSLEIIAIFAAALFTFRSHELLQVTKIDDVKDLFTDALEIQSQGGRIRITLKSAVKSTPMVVAPHTPGNSKITETQSLNVIKNLIRVSISEICYLRSRKYFGHTMLEFMFYNVVDLFPDEVFKERVYADMQIKCLAPQENSRDQSMQDAYSITEWLEAGAFDAMEKKYLLQLEFCIYALGKNKTPQNLLECYTYKIKETSNGSTFSTSFTGTQNIDSHPEKVKTQAVQMIRNLVSITNTLEPLPKSRYITMKIEDKLGYDLTVIKKCMDEVTRLYSKLCMSWSIYFAKAILWRMNHDKLIDMEREVAFDGYKVVLEVAEKAAQTTKTPGKKTPQRTSMSKPRPTSSCAYMPILQSNQMAKKRRVMISRVAATPMSMTR
ncbi:hypothetical protein B5M09_004045 [Aphanomyces astaci]|uniref:HORMA domain-containing protein n=1 Tax=Aphanomyces astaci TaxID=112090 RepID=A0A3R7Y874_APHAT|nr:hypothetical protein B5M09_004045 [Aphanomyces astaci]